VTAPNGPENRRLLNAIAGVVPSGFRPSRCPALAGRTPPEQIAVSDFRLVPEGRKTFSAR